MMTLYRDFTCQEEIDREYNMALSVIDTGNWMKQYEKESALARQNLDCIADVSFGPTRDETMDIFPAEKKGSPVFVFIHGGYWHRCSSKDFSFTANGLVRRGLTVVVTNYSLCPKVTITEITRQSRAVIAWLYHHAVDVNGDPDRIFVAGHSAGGHQAGMLASTDWPGRYGLPGNIIKGAIPISGIFDLRPLRYSYLQPKLLLTHDEILHQSPYLNIPPVGPPLLITFGEKETGEFHRQSDDYLEAWRAGGLSGERLVQKGKHHFSAIEELNEPDSRLCSAVIDFISSHPGL